MKRKPTTKPYWDMNLEELREATREFDGPIDLARTRPLTKSQRARFERARRQPARSIFVSRSTSARGGSKSCQLCMEIDPRLLNECVKYAAAHNMSLAELVAKSLKSSLSFVA
jgi:hypothetical protein